MKSKQRMNYLNFLVSLNSKYFTVFTWDWTSVIKSILNTPGVETISLLFALEMKWNTNGINSLGQPMSRRAPGDLPQLLSSSALSQSFSPSHFQNCGMHWVVPGPQLNSFARHVLESARTKTHHDFTFSVDASVALFCERLSQRDKEKSIPGKTTRNEAQVHCYDRKTNSKCTHEARRAWF